MPLNCRRLLLVGLAACFVISAGAGEFDELQVKRKEPFEFAAPPAVTREGDRITIAFETKAGCDATIAIEDGDGRIVRHLASGVLGDNAPAPFQKGTLKQSVIWDGKDDQGKYIDDKENHVVRVSLGMQPKLERTLFWTAFKRYGTMPIPVPRPEGVYVYDGKGCDFVRLYDHDGRYIRTVYPFPAAKLKDVQGLDWYDYPQGYKLPVKGGLYQCTLLTSGTSWNSGNYHTAMLGTAATAMAVNGKRIALAEMYFNRISTDGDSGGLNLRGPKIGFTVPSLAGGVPVDVGPASVAFSPDGKTLYLTGYLWRTGSWNATPDCEHAVLKMAYDGDKEPEVFVGERKKDGSDDAHLCVPTSVATDAKGTVYVSDYMNDRVQVFDPSGKLLKSIKTPKPAKVCVNQNDGEIWAFSYEVVGVPHAMAKARGLAQKLEHTVTRFSALPEAKQLKKEEFPLGQGETMGFEFIGHVFETELDSWAKEPEVWVVGRKHHARGDEFNFWGGYAQREADPKLWQAGIRIQKVVKGKWDVVFSFGDETVKEVISPKPPTHNIQRLVVNPVTGMLYIGEADSGPTGKASNRWMEVNPENGKLKWVDLPFNAMEGVFDMNGRVYLRNTDMVARYDFRTWREVPWDYGEERDKLGNDGSINGHSTSVMSGLKMPSTSPVCYHQGGIDVNAKGDLVASCAYRYVGISGGQRIEDGNLHKNLAYAPQVYPGRVASSTSPCIHVWDKHGNLKVEDAVPGVEQCDGVGIDVDGNIYLMTAPTRVYGGKRYFDHMTQTLLRTRPKAAKLVASSAKAAIPLPKDSAPKRPGDVDATRTGVAWIDGADWFYGGVGFAGFNMHGAGGGCACWFSRFTLDYFARSIAPEPQQYRVAIVDKAGNLILRIGQYGNVDDGKPLVADGGPKDTNGIGGDEVGLVHPCFVGTMTDRRIFISDYGNARVVSVKIGYHDEKRVPLKEIPDKQ
ncbi:MAG: SMP-30/gluconolactonase/LRE family protein [Planctomycetes bacterium]|nr:SMP-30/gluconolactonase/LRE family protein [Planctomycetota bacterium]